MSFSPLTKIPEHSTKKYQPIDQCIYCGSKNKLSDEHIIPLAIGGRWVLPMASCSKCSVITGRFEQVCMRKMLGAMRMYFDFPTRRRGQRPDTLPLKVKFHQNEEWQYFEIPQEEYPFLILFPHFNMPDDLSGGLTTDGREAVTSKIWVRAPQFEKGIQWQSAKLCKKYGFSEVEPGGDVVVPEFCMMLAKIAHSFTVAELGIRGFEAFLPKIITEGAMQDRAKVIGGLCKVEPRTELLHELSFGTHTYNKADLLGVRIRLLSHFEAPTYFVVAGRRL